LHQITKKNYFKNGKVYIWKETFVIIKSKKVYPNAFANIIDKNETTEGLRIRGQIFILDK